MSNKDLDHAPLEPHVADKLLELLGTDDAFRSKFKEDPAAALADAGHPTAARLTGARPSEEGQEFYCMTAENLASKEEILAAREELKSFLTSYTNHRVIFCFEAGKISSTLRSR